jgi:hypothetical protein
MNSVEKCILMALRDRGPMTYFKLAEALRDCGIGTEVFEAMEELVESGKVVGSLSTPKIFRITVKGEEAIMADVLSSLR